MQVINRFRLRDFWAEHPRSEYPLRSWFQLLSSYDWDSPEALQATFPHVQELDGLTTFAIDGSTYFPLTVIDFAEARIFVRDILMHTEYHDNGWKRLTEPEESLEVGGDRAYMDLVSAFPLRPIQDDEHLGRAAALVDDLLSRAERNQDEQDYLDVLSLLVAEYERRHVPIPPVSGTDVLRALITEHRLSQAELIPLLGSKARVTAVLREARPLELRQVSRASRYFKLPPEAFMDPDELDLENLTGARRRR